MTDTATAVPTAAADDHTPADPAATVSPRTETALREAMDRLLAGKPQHTDGRLIKDNLWKEAQVSRATMNRARQVMAEWDARVAERGGLTADQARHAEQITELRRQLADKTRLATQLRHQVDAAATVIAELHHDNLALRQQLNHQADIIDLDSRRTQP